MGKQRQPGWWYPYIFVGAFMVVIGVNATLAYFATSTFTGLAVTDAYEKGRLYNRNLALAKAQAELGWTVETEAKPVAGGHARVEVAVSYRDRDGRPVEGLEVQAAMIRPTVKGYDHEIAFTTLAPGVYGGTFDLPLNGVWDMDVIALGPGVAYEHEKRFVVP
ncbi:FixH family protein [Magnetospirillum sp. UT-4]|uniref:FixH family protein n=1 Tax=Magnetospirillum sp. UT-4 TaxID=2681467 RepID=UPI00137C68E0|nr:FixH family protein [Magnetospirillum sp. UT-4]CAA7611903.1 putative Nitrogen fixation protein FixH [Magnetospirillum sp. UT-4]